MERLGLRRGRSMPALVELFSKHVRRDSFSVEPTLWIKADGEILALTIILSMIITGIDNPDTYDSNPVKDVLGYNNPCVFWDAPPALYPAAVLFCWGAFCASMRCRTREE